MILLDVVDVHPRHLVFLSPIHFIYLVLKQLASASNDDEEV